VTHSIVSVSEGRVFSERDIEASDRAKRIAAATGRAPGKVEVALREAVEVVREEPVLITRTAQGILTDFSGVDQKNAPPGKYIALPLDSDESARKLHSQLSKEFGVRLPVIITDTHGRPWRLGAVNTTIGVAGMSPFFKNAGKEDLYGRHLRSSLVCLADELAQAAELVMGQADEGIPVVIVRGVNYDSGQGTASEILRSEAEDLFHGKMEKD
jgi:coenzyme F420-0:L-glutamate ligase/coenzyme F420-1:gamma-L-glutamate ligase